MTFDIHVRGAGPAGSSFALAAVHAMPGARVMLVESQPSHRPGAGVVFSSSYVDRLASDDLRLLDVPAHARSSWRTTVTRLPGFRLGSPSPGTTAVSRAHLMTHLRHLTGVHPRISLHETDTELAPPDLLVGADGAASALRDTHLRPEPPRVGISAYVWASVPVALEPQFRFLAIGEAWMIVHAYPHAADESTLVVEALPEALDDLGLLSLDGAEIAQKLGACLWPVTGGAPVSCHSAGWERHRSVRVPHWWTSREGQPPVVVIGDAAHSLHYSVGAGTSLAIDDALSLASALAGTADVCEALGHFESERRPVIDAWHDESDASRGWFEAFLDHPRPRGAQTVFAVRSRRSHNTFSALRDQDPAFTDHVLAQVTSGVTTTSIPTRPWQLPLATARGTLGTRLIGSRDLDGLAVLGVDGTAGRVTPVSQWSEVPALAARASGQRYDLVAVAAQPGATRIARSGLAHHVRGRLRLPVLYVHDSESREELDTLIAAGRIDCAAEAADFADASRGDARSVA